MKGHVEISLYDSDNRIVHHQSGDNTILNNHLTYIDELYLKSAAIPVMGSVNTPGLSVVSPFPLINNGLGYLSLFGDTIGDDEYKVYKSFLANTDGRSSPPSEEDIEAILNNPNIHEGVLTDISQTSSRITRTWKFGKGVYGDIASLSLMKSPPYSYRSIDYRPRLFNITNATSYGRLLFFEPYRRIGYYLYRNNSKIQIYKFSCVDEEYGLAPRYIEPAISTDANNRIGDFDVQDALDYSITIDIEEGQTRYGDSWDVYACKRVNDYTANVLRIHKDDNDDCSLSEFTVDITANSYPMYASSPGPIIHNGYLHYKSKINSSDTWSNVACFSKLAFVNDDLVIDEDLYDNQIGYNIGARQIQFDGCVEYSVTDEDYNTVSVSYDPTPVIGGSVKKHIRPNFVALELAPCTKLSIPVGGHITYKDFGYMTAGSSLYLLDNYLGTKFNLETPIHKGQNQTLAIAYTLNF